MTWMQNIGEPQQFGNRIEQQEQHQDGTNDVARPTTGFEDRLRSRLHEVFLRVHERVGA
jgi:hypothetical protein